jgi:hypothetical protein
VNEEQELQNAKTLASLLGVAEEEACERLRATVQITWDPADASGRSFGEFLQIMVARTITEVGTPATPFPSAGWELVVNGAAPRSPSAKTIYAHINSAQFAVGLNSHSPATSSGEPVPRILALLAACYGAAQLCHYALGLEDGRVHPAGVRINFGEWPGVHAGIWAQEVTVGTLSIAGGGAVGNAFLYALQSLPVRGRAFVIDPKPINGGILNRCLWFQSGDEGNPKATVLAQRAGAAMGGMVVKPIAKTLQEARADIGEFECLVIGVDSRLARRNLQNEVPLEVFDASTTTVEEVVFHHNLQFDGQACMACIYFETHEEQTFAQHVAKMLNVSLEDVQKLYVDEAAAQKICERYPDLRIAVTKGKAYDSLFKQLCATAQLKSAEEKQVFAPFAFVSQLAGTIQAIELFLRRHDPARSASFNHWRASPWRSPVLDLQAVKPRLASCAVCSSEDYQKLASAIWGNYRAM